jgi:hypothetical protein
MEEEKFMMDSCRAGWIIEKELTPFVAKKYVATKTFQKVFSCSSAYNIKIKDSL